MKTPPQSNGQVSAQVYECALPVDTGWVRAGLCLMSTSSYCLPKLVRIINPGCVGSSTPFNMIKNEIKIHKFYQTGNDSNNFSYIYVINQSDKNMREEKINGWKAYVTEENQTEVEALKLQFWEYKERKGINSNEYPDHQAGYMVKDFEWKDTVFIPDFFFDKLFECIDRWGPSRK